ncbi:MAG: ComF family protein [Elusimicrobia bacterium]|nr:ComF family protein [Elusimicrobiota bacterium]
MGWEWARETLWHWIWPRTCAHCREDLPKGADGPLCRACLLLLVPWEFSPSGGLKRCPLLRAAYLYRGSAVSVVHAFKYRGQKSAAKAAGLWMAAELARFPELERPRALVPVPLHPSRLRERGYNQSLLLAESLSRACSIPVRELLVRTRKTKPQLELNRQERLKNLQHSMQARQRLEGGRFWIIDDVCTSGASLEAAAEALLDAGATQALGYVFARQLIEKGRVSSARASAAQACAKPARPARGARAK